MEKGNKSPIDFNQMGKNDPKEGIISRGEEAGYDRKEVDMRAFVFEAFVFDKQTRTVSLRGGWKFDAGSVG